MAIDRKCLLWKVWKCSSFLRKVWKRLWRFGNESNFYFISFRWICWAYLAFGNLSAPTGTDLKFSKSFSWNSFDVTSLCDKFLNCSICCSTEKKPKNFVFFLLFRKSMLMLQPNYLPVKVFGFLGRTELTEGPSSFTNRSCTTCCTTWITFEANSSDSLKENSMKRILETPLHFNTKSHRIKLETIVRVDFIKFIFCRFLWFLTEVCSYVHLLWSM